MAFAITYRHPSSPYDAAAALVEDELQIAEAVERLERRGYEVTGVTPPPYNLIREGKAPVRWASADEACAAERGDER